MKKDAIQIASEIAASAFREQGWTWARVGLPDAFDIEMELRRMNRRIITDKATSIETGRLKLEKDAELGGTRMYLCLGELP